MSKVSKEVVILNADNIGIPRSLVYKKFTLNKFECNSLLAEKYCPTELFRFHKEIFSDGREVPAFYNMVNSYSIELLKEYLYKVYRCVVYKTICGKLGILDSSSDYTIFSTKGEEMDFIWELYTKREVCITIEVEEMGYPDE